MANRKLPPNEQVVAWYQSGKSTGEIAEMTGVKPVTVDCCLRRIGVKLRTPKEASLLRSISGRCNTARFWLGKKQSPEMVEKRVSKIRGEKHYLWKGGQNRRPYRNVKCKESCAKCGGKENLGFHHLDFDHYNDNPDNLQVLCVSCHISLHKQTYWDAIHAGNEPLRSNGPIGWEKR